MIFKQLSILSIIFILPTSKPGSSGIVERQGRGRAGQGVVWKKSVDQHTNGSLINKWPPTFVAVCACSTEESRATSPQIAAPDYLCDEASKLAMV